MSSSKVALQMRWLDCVKLEGWLAAVVFNLPPKLLSVFSKTLELFCLLAPFPYFCSAHPTGQAHQDQLCLPLSCLVPWYSREVGPFSVCLSPALLFVTVLHSFSLLVLEFLSPIFFCHTLHAGEGWILSCSLLPSSSEYFILWTEAGGLSLSPSSSKLHLHAKCHWVLISPERVQENPSAVVSQLLNLKWNPASLFWISILVSSRYFKLHMAPTNWFSHPQIPFFLFVFSIPLKWHCCQPNVQGKLRQACLI